MKQILFLIFAITAFTTSSFAQQPKTVTDYFLAMPDSEEFPYYRSEETNDKTTLRKFRKSLIKTEDIKNGYLKLGGDWDGFAEIALFKKTDGNYLIAEMRADCDPVCEGFLRFFTYDRAKWQDVTHEYLPEYGEIVSEFNKKRPQGIPAKNVAGDDTVGFEFLYHLPQIGRAIRVSCAMCIPSQKTAENKFFFAEYLWNGTKFVKK